MPKYEVYADVPVMFVVDTDEDRVLKARVVERCPVFAIGDWDAPVWRIHDELPGARQFEELHERPVEIEWARRVVNNTDAWPELEDWW